MDNPFGLSANVQWLFQTFSTPVIGVLGWVAVFSLNRRNIKAEKRLIIKLQAYDNIKDILNSTIEAFAYLESFMFLNGRKLEILVESDISYEFTKHALLKEFEDQTFRSLYDNANKEFNKFIYKWEQHEIVFLQLLPQRYAISEEHEEAIFDVVGNVRLEFDRYLMSVQSGTMQEEDRQMLIQQMEIGRDRCSTITCCLCDIRNNLQNYVYGDILKSKNEPRRVADIKKYLTIDTLMIKHKSTLEYIENLNKPKSFRHRIWEQIKSFKKRTG